MIKIGEQIGALNRLTLIFLTAIVGIYFAKMQGIQTMKTGIANLYQNKIPVYEMISGASIAIAALLLIIPGFFTDFTGLVLLIKPVRNWIISNILPINNHQKGNHRRKNVIDIDKDDSEWDIFVIWLLKFM